MARSPSRSTTPTSTSGASVPWGGPDGLLDSLKNATEIRSVPGGGGVGDVDGAQVIFDDELVVMRIGVG